MEPSGCNRRQPAANRPDPKPRGPANSVAIGCDQLPATFHGKQGVCRGCHPSRKVPSLQGRGRHLFVTAGYFLVLQSGAARWSQRQPVHASQIMK
jgi:hypothetical protein